MTLNLRQGARTRLEGKTTRHGVGLLRRPQHGDEEGKSNLGSWALGMAPNDGIPVIPKWVIDVVEDEGCVREVAIGGDGGELEKFGAKGVRKLEETGGNEVGLDLFDVRERIAFLDCCVDEEGGGFGDHAAEFGAALLKVS